ncbi:GntR family transcriptional regulator [Mycobacterium yunnanensis]|uniref:GntR family transcriptional regulator n=1 Tax=Mycobacterium yunnanensis TaxID=368477 RepID=A0A9X2Z9Q5_9MYCO|nr:GntR family transcriptional regulator [Mycobacterium yunnanensis]
MAAVRDGIRDGRYIPGQRLVENDVMAELGVGRNALREAFSRLRSDGFVVVEAHRGASVRRLSRRDVAHLYDLREALESLAARLAAQGIHTPGHRERLIDATATMRDVAHTDDLASYVDENLRFHRVIVGLSGHDRLTELVDQLHIQTFRVQFRQVLADTSPHMRDRSVVEHQAVADAILGGDAARAEEGMRSHLQHMRADVMRLPDADFA